MVECHRLFETDSHQIPKTVYQCSWYQHKALLKCISLLKLGMGHLISHSLSCQGNHPEVGHAFRTKPQLTGESPVITVSPSPGSVLSDGQQPAPPCKRCGQPLLGFMTLGCMGARGWVVHLLRTSQREISFSFIDLPTKPTDLEGDGILVPYLGRYEHRSFPRSLGVCCQSVLPVGTRASITSWWREFRSFLSVY